MCHLSRGHPQHRRALDVRGLPLHSARRLRARVGALYDHFRSLLAGCPPCNEWHGQGVDVRALPISANLRAACVTLCCKECVLVQARERALYLDAARSPAVLRQAMWAAASRIGRAAGDGSGSLVVPAQLQPPVPSGYEMCDMCASVMCASVVCARARVLLLLHIFLRTRNKHKKHRDTRACVRARARACVRAHTHTHILTLTCTHTHNIYALRLFFRTYTHRSVPPMPRAAQRHVPVYSERHSSRTLRRACRPSGERGKCRGGHVRRRVRETLALRRACVRASVPPGFVWSLHHAGNVRMLVPVVALASASSKVRVVKYE